MSLFSKLRHALFNRAQPKVVRLDEEMSGMRIDELPPFTLKVADLMRYDPQVRIGLGARNGLLMAAQVEVSGGDSRVVAWVQHQWDSLWHATAHQLLRAKLYGFLPFEVVYRRAAGGQFSGLIEVERLVDYPAKDVRLLAAGDKIVGFTYEGPPMPGMAMASGTGQVRNAEFGMRNNGQHSASTPHSTIRTPQSSSDNSINLFAPQALVCTFDAECGNPYGCALLARAYPAWFEKWMPGGAKRTLQLRMIKDAYIGEIDWYIPHLTMGMQLH